jgi:uncharacterized membrane protein YjjP (DUF1212 family)
MFILLRVYFNRALKCAVVLMAVLFFKVLWGGRWQDGAACSTGEEVEQINSYFSRLGNTTKYMLPEGWCF